MAGNETVSEVARSLGLEKVSPVEPDDIQRLKAEYVPHYSSDAVSLELRDPQNKALRGVLFLLTGEGPFYSRCSRQSQDTPDHEPDNEIGPSSHVVETPKQFISDNGLTFGGKELVELLLAESVAATADRRRAYLRRMQEEPDVHPHYSRDFHRKNAERARADFEA